jgi:hypothetical protein
LRPLRVAPASVQLALPDPVMTEQVERWWTLPEQTRTQVLTLLAALISRGVLIETTPSTTDPSQRWEVEGDE